MRLFTALTQAKEMKYTSSGMKDALSKIGSIKEAISKEADSPLRVLVSSIATQLISRLKVGLREAGVDSEGSLGQSIAPQITETENNIRITITANEYWDFVNSGVNGTKRGQGSPYSFKTPFGNTAMVESLRKGMALKGLSLPAGFKSYEAYAWASAVKVKVEGIEANHFVDNVLTDSFIKEISLSLAKELGKEVILKVQSN